MNIKDSDIKDLLAQQKKITVYGLSPKIEKASHSVAFYMRDQGWDVIGVYPRSHEVNDFEIYKSLKEVPLEYRKFINIFRSSDKIPELVEEIIELGGTEVLWLQLGIENQQAETRAQEAGIKVVSNRCMKIEHRTLKKT